MIDMTKTSVAHCLLLSALMMACNKAAPAPAVDGASVSDSATMSADLSSSPDLRMIADFAGASTAGIACGSTICAPSAQLCCTGDKGLTGQCQLISNASCGASTFACDGPEDCPPFEPECCVSGGRAQCTTAGSCQASSGTQLCHESSTCGLGTNCCAAPNSPYALCLAVCPAT